MKKKFPPSFWPMPVTTDRLLIRPRKITDSEMVLKAIQDSKSELREWMPWAQAEIDLDHVIKACARAETGFRLKNEFTFSILDPDEKIFIGAIGLQNPIIESSSYNIAAWGNSNFSGRGLMSEAVNALCRYCFGALNSQMLETHCAIANQRSFDLIRRLGFKDEKVLKEYETGPDGTRRDCMVALLSDPKNLPPLSVAWE